MKRFLTNTKVKISGISGLVLACFVFGLLLLPTGSEAFFGKVKEDKNPKLANYFLKWTISDQEAKELAKWDVLVLDMEVQNNSRENLKKIRQYNPDILILAYISSSEVRYDIVGNEHAKLRSYLLGSIIDGWWLTNNKNWKLSTWPNTHLMNMTDDADSSNNIRWNTFLPEFVSKNILSTGLWDGVFYDNVWSDVSWVNDGNMDLNRDRVSESKTEINSKWIAGVEKMLKKTRDLVGNNYIIMGNSSTYDGYQPYLNGMMFENFPTPWESGGDWSELLKSYYRIQKLNVEPKISIINAISKNQNDYFKMRSALMSTLLTGAYFSFDYDISNHSQTWWYDEYDINLGKTKGGLVRVDGSGAGYAQGVWRQDFADGAIYLNSTFKQVRVDLPYRMQKIQGKQDKVVNDGGLVDYLILGPTDGIVLKNVLKLYDINLLNDKKYKIFDNSGQMVYGEYSQKNAKLPAEARVSQTRNGAVVEVKDKKNVADFKNDGSIERVEGASAGQRSLIRILNDKINKLLGIISAYPAKFLCGVKVAVGDVDGDGQKEIVAVPAFGGADLKIYSAFGQLKKEFFFADKKLRAQYDLVLSDINNDGKDEILIASY